jgi:uncharacterized protein
MLREVLLSSAFFMSKTPTPFRLAIETYIHQHAIPIDKYSHQPRLYALTLQLAKDAQLPFDDEILHAAVWLHDLGVFEGHRPEDPALLSTWDNVAYACKTIPALLKQWGFPPDKIPAVIEAIEQHAAHCQPTQPEAILLHDADLLELLGAVGIMRALSKVGRDTRYATHGEAVKVLEKALVLPEKLQLAAAKTMANSRILLLEHFLSSLSDETFNVLF